jgi:uncharacterized protein (UPF0264 family)
MTRLLVSVRDRAEALTALEAGADLLDIKEPLRGSLGGAEAETIIKITQAVAGRIPISAAFGELADWNGTLGDTFDEAARRIDLAKIGLANCAPPLDWQDRWQTFFARLPRNVGRVAVVYADASANAPADDEIVAHAVRLHCRAVLVDTFDKRAGSLPDHWAISRIHSSIVEIQSHGMLAVLAGGLSASAIETLLPLAPDFFAVRGAVCTAGDRNGALCAERIRRLKAAIGHPSNFPESKKEFSYSAHIEAMPGFRICAF